MERIKESNEDPYWGTVEDNRFMRKNVVGSLWYYWKGSVGLLQHFPNFEFTSHNTEGGHLCPATLAATISLRQLPLPAGNGWREGGEEISSSG